MDEDSGLIRVWRGTIGVRATYGYIDREGKEVIPLIYDGAFNFSEGLARVAIEDSGKEKCGYIDTTGKEVIPLIYDGAYSFSEGLAMVGMEDSEGDIKWGYIDMTGKEMCIRDRLMALPLSENPWLFQEPDKILRMIFS